MKRLAYLLNMILLLNCSNYESTQVSNKLDSEENSDKKSLELLEQCKPIAGKLKSYLNLAYAEQEQVNPNLLSLDIYTPEFKKLCHSVPVVVWIHGGLWNSGDKSDFISQKRRFFTSLGYVFVSVNYQLSPRLALGEELPANRVEYPTHQLDIIKAIKWLREHIHEYKGDANQMALFGHGTGAYLAATIGMNKDFVKSIDSKLEPTFFKCIGSYDGSLDLEVSVTEGSEEEKTQIFENVFGIELGSLIEASPINYSTEENLPPMQLVLRGSFARQDALKDFEKNLRNNGNYIEIIDAPGLSHKEVDSLIGDDVNLIMTSTIKRFLNNICF